ncbi:MAG: Gfo/Idh/MocA family oxidoreductase [Alphaproteobacteria bacterium]|nr:Gfo/Idh/MocA family oxidoreductase [Alphaproteobacteria bacterium]
MLKAAVIGAGAFGRHHATKYRALPDVELVAIADSSPEARRAAVAAHGVPAVSDWRELLGTVDIVSVASPAVTHSTIVRAFLNAGAHVLVEKPIATSIEEADDLITLAERANRILTVGHQERFVFAQTGLLDYEETPLEVSCWRKGPWSGRGSDVSVVLDLMIHDLDLVHQLIEGKVRTVQARGRIEKSLLADEVAAAVLFENGAVARLETSRIAAERRRGMKAVYADGVVEIDFLTRKVTNTTPRALKDLDAGDPLGESVAAFVAAARTGKTPLVRPRQARRALETALLIDDAAERASLIRTRPDLVAYAAAN